MMGVGKGDGGSEGRKRVRGRREEGTEEEKGIQFRKKQNPYNCPLSLREEDLDELALRMGGGRGRESGRDRTVGGDWNQGDAGGERKV